ncbi:MAG: hypothetical protein ABJL33_15395 [Hyphomicrobiales bacterium]
MKMLFPLAAVTILTACKTLIGADLFTSDLIAAVNGDTITAPLIISADTSTLQKCQEFSPDILTAVQSIYDTAEFIGCEKIGFDTYGRFRVQAGVISFTDTAPVPDAAFAFGVRKEGASYHVSYLINPDATRAIWDALPETMTKYETFKLDPILSAVLNNDLRNTVTITTDDVFADGTPVQGTATRDLPRRDQVELKMSDVTNTAFGTTNNVSHIVTFSITE